MALQKMNPEWKAKWVEALTSGKYVQGVESLRRQEYDEDASVYTDRTQHCCLGVLADIVDPKQERWHDTDCALPDELAALVGLDGDCNIGAQGRLIEFNDGKGWSFAKIAAYIKRYL